jgi:uncharacterized protein YqgC (DUF456 family)
VGIDYVNDVMGAKHPSSSSYSGVDAIIGFVLTFFKSLCTLIILLPAIYKETAGEFFFTYTYVLLMSINT